MESCNGLFLLLLGLCMIICFVNSIEIYAVNSINPNEDISKKLESLKFRKLRYEWWQSYGFLQPAQKRNIERDLNGVKQMISELETNSRVAYRDYLDMMEKLKDNYEREKTKLQDQLEQEKKNLQKQLEKANNSQKESIDRVAAVQKKYEEDSGIYTEKIDALTKEVQRTAKEYAEYTQQVQQAEITSAKYKKLLEEKEKIEQELKEEKYQSQKDTEQLLRKLKEAHNRHSWALDALSIYSQSDYKPVPIPYQDEINELRHNVHAFIYTGNNNGLAPSVTKEKLKVLLQKLFSEGRLPESLPPNKLQMVLDAVEISTVDLRKMQIKRRKSLQRQTEQKDNENKEEELVSLNKANEEVEISNEFLQDIALRKAYLKAIMQVEEMLEKLR